MGQREDRSYRRRPRMLNGHDLKYDDVRWANGISACALSLDMYFEPDTDVLGEEAGKAEAGRWALIHASSQ